MNAIKALTINAQAHVRTSLGKRLSSWGVITQEIDLLPTLLEILALSPQLIIIDDRLFSASDPLWENMVGLMEPESVPRVIVLMYSDENLVPINEQKYFSSLSFPYSAASLFHSIHQALCMQKSEAHKKMIASQLTHIENMLGNLSERLDLEKNVSILEQDNVPVPEINNIMRKMKPIIVSLLQDARQFGPLHPYQTQLQLLEQYFTEIGFNFCKQDKKQLSIIELLKNQSLSQKELKVISMIASGLTTEEISNLNHVSYDTVKCHRRNIRKKLNLVGNKNTLEEYVQKITGTNISMSSSAAA